MVRLVKKKSEYCIRLEEKQKLRYNYGVTERQLLRYVKKSTSGRRFYRTSDFATTGDAVGQYLLPLGYGANDSRSSSGCQSMVTSRLMAVWLAFLAISVVLVM